MLNVELLSTLAMIMYALRVWDGKIPTHWIQSGAKRHVRWIAMCQVPKAHICNLQSIEWTRKETIDACILHDIIAQHIVTCHVKTTLTKNSTFRLNKMISFVICAIEYETRNAEKIPRINDIKHIPNVAGFKTFGKHSVS